MTTLAPRASSELLQQVLPQFAAYADLMDIRIREFNELVGVTKYKYDTIIANHNNANNGHRLPKLNVLTKLLDGFDAVAATRRMSDGQTAQMLAISTSIYQLLSAAYQAADTAEEGRAQEKEQRLGERLGARKRHSDILNKRRNTLGLTLDDMSKHFGVTRETIRLRETYGVPEDIFLEMCKELGMDNQGTPSEVVPEWIVEAQAKNKKVKEERLNKIAEERERRQELQDAVEKLVRIRAYAPLTNGYASYEELKGSTIALGFPSPEALLKDASHLQYFETSQLGKKVKALGRASAILRSYYGKTAEDLTYAMPDPHYSMSRVSVNALENPGHEYGNASEKQSDSNNVSQGKLCNMIAGLFVLDSQQPKEKQVLQDSKSVEFIAWAMERKDPHFTFTHRLRIKVEKAIDDMVEIAEKIKPTLKPGEGHQVGVLHHNARHK